MLLMTKVKNAIRKTFPDAVFKLNSININGAKYGCSGFIEVRDVIVYISTDTNCMSKYLYRYARSMRDFTGCTNQFAKEADFIDCVINALKDKEQYGFEYAIASPNSIHPRDRLFPKD